MAYQFDPRPEGLHYEPLRVACCAKTIWCLRDGAPHVWIDLHSLFQAVGVSFQKWRSTLRSHRRAFGLEECFDRTLQETMLVPDNLVVNVLDLILQGSVASTGEMGQRVRTLKSAWPGVRLRLRTGDKAAAPKPAKPAPRHKPTPLSKVGAFQVRQIHKALTAGENKSGIAHALRVSVYTVNRVAAGPENLNSEALAAWHETFGAQNRK